MGGGGGGGNTKRKLRATKIRMGGRTALFEA